MRNSLKGPNDTSNPEFLYRYQPPIIERLWDVIVNGKLYFSNPKHVNDPYDSKLSFNFKGNTRQWTKYLRQLLKEQEPNKKKWEINNEVRSVIKSGQHKTINNDTYADATKDYGITCFSDDNSNILMWSHYADCHRGICLKFYHDQNDPVFGAAQKIKYEEDRPYPSFFDDDRGDRIVEMLTTKSIDWEYENEWRIIGYDGNITNHIQGPGQYNYNHSLLTGVILGCKATDNTKEIISSFVNQAPHYIDIYQAKEKEKSFGLDIVKIT